MMVAMRLPNAHLQRPKFVWRGRYWLYYALAFLFGARKQVFITFGPWVLIRIFHQPAWIFAQLWIAAAILGVFFQPALGRAIDRFGERTVLLADSPAVPRPTSHARPISIAKGNRPSNVEGNSAADSDPAPRVWICSSISRNIAPRSPRR